MNKIKTIIYDQPEKWFHIREIARLFGLSPNTVKSKLIKLFKDKLVQKRKLSNLIQFRANLENNNYLIDKKLYNLGLLFNSQNIIKIVKGVQDD